MKNVVSIFFTNQYNEILILKRSLKSHYWPGLYHMLSGKMKEEETPLSALKREVEEEIGVKDFKIVKKVEPFVVKRDVGVINVILYQGYLPKETNIKINDENSNWLWICPNDCKCLNCTPALINELDRLGIGN